MTELVSSIDKFFLAYPSLEYLVIFLAATLGGELALFTLGFLVSQGVASVIPVSIFAFLGAFTPNVLWYLLGKTTLVNTIIGNRYTDNTVSVVIEAIKRMSRGNHFWALAIIKFLVGTPVFLVMYANKTKFSFLRFLYYQSFGIFLSFFVLFSIGFISGLGFIYITEVSKNIYGAVGFILLIIILYTTAQIQFEKKFTEIDQ